MEETFILPQDIAPEQANISFKQYHAARFAGITFFVKLFQDYWVLVEIKSCLVGLYEFTIFLYFVEI